MRQVKPFKQQKGIALLMAVVAVAFVTLISVAMMSEQNQLLRRAQNTLTSDAAWQYALSGEQVIALFLKQDHDQGLVTKQDYDFEEPFWGASRTFPIPDGRAVISGEIQDLSDQFNINNLINTGGELNKPAYEAFIRLLQKLDLPEELAPALLDWIDADDALTDNGAEDDFYMGLEKPMTVANHPLKSMQELKLVRGFTDIMPTQDGDKTVIQVLTPFITVLPPETPLNINRADQVVIAAYLPHLDSSQVSSLLKGRPFESMSQFVSDRNNQPKPNKKSKKQLLDYSKLPLMSVKSEYIKVNLVVSMNGINLPVVSVLKRDPKTGMTHIVSRTKGRN